MDKTQLEVITEIIKIFELKQEDVVAINENFQGIMAQGNETMIDMIKSCKVYDPEAFIAGAMVTTSILDMVRTNVAAKEAELHRLEGNFRDVIWYFLDQNFKFWSRTFIYH